MAFRFMCGLAIGMAPYVFTCIGSNYQCPSKINQFVVGDIAVHIHHWLIHLLWLIVYLICTSKCNVLFVGIIAGGLIHGVMFYNDWYIIFKNHQDM